MRKNAQLLQALHWDLTTRAFMGHADASCDLHVVSVDL